MIKLNNPPSDMELYDLRNVFLKAFGVAALCIVILFGVIALVSLNASWVFEESIDGALGRLSLIWVGLLGFVGYLCYAFEAEIN